MVELSQALIMILFKTLMIKLFETLIIELFKALMIELFESAYNRFTSRHIGIISTIVSCHISRVINAIMPRDGVELLQRFMTHDALFPRHNDGMCSRVYDHICSTDNSILFTLMSVINSSETTKRANKLTVYQ